jgi:hypothetical protein
VNADFHDISTTRSRAAGVIDITPLYKYEVSGPDAVRLLNRVMTRHGEAADKPDLPHGVAKRARCSTTDDRARRGPVPHHRRRRVLPVVRAERDRLDVEVADVSDFTAALALQDRLSKVLQDATGQVWTDRSTSGGGAPDAGVTVGVPAPATPATVATSCGWPRMTPSRVGSHLGVGRRYRITPWASAR